MTAFILEGITLLLALIGVLWKTRTSDPKGEAKKEKLTGLGFVVLLLLLVSTGFKVQKISNDREQSARDKAATEQANSRLREALADANASLKHQRFNLVTLIAQQYKPDGVRFGRSSQFKGSGEEGPSDEWSELQTKFPSRHVLADGWRLEFDPSSARSFWSGSKHPDDFNPPQDDYVEMQSEAINLEYWHGFWIRKYKDVAEVLFDFKGGEQVGTLYMWRRNDVFTSEEAEKVRAELSDPIAGFEVFAKLTNKSAALVWPYLRIPLTLGAPSVKGKRLAFPIIAGEPILDSLRYEPI